jgi:hypothetical protein
VNWLKLGLQLVPAIVSAIHAVEQLVNRKGADKENMAVDAVAAGLQIAEGLAGRDLVRDAAVEPAVRDFMRAYVALQNAVRAARELQPES